MISQEAYVFVIVRRCGYGAILRDLREAKAGLVHGSAQFLDMQSWQETYRTWLEQVLECWHVIFIFRLYHSQNTVSI